MSQLIQVLQLKVKQKKDKTEQRLNEDEVNENCPEPIITNADVLLSDRGNAQHLF